MRRSTIFLFLTLTLSSAVALAQGQPVVRLDREIVLSGVRGRIDHLAADVAGFRVFVCALGNSTVEVVALNQGRQVGSITQQKEPQGVVYVPRNKTLYVATGGDGAVRSYDAGTLKPLKMVDLGDDADNLRYDATRRRILAGFGAGGIAELGLDLTVRRKIALPVHPEAFDISPDGARLFVNLPLQMSIATIDLKTYAVNATWGHPGTLANFPMAIDATQQRLLIACRMPARLLMVNTANGAVTARMKTVGDADDLFYDAAHGVAYVIGGGGFVDVVRVGPGDNFSSLSHIATAAGARTGLYVPEWNKLVVAAPRNGASAARLLVFSVAYP